MVSHHWEWEGDKGKWTTYSLEHSTAITKAASAEEKSVSSPPYVCMCTVQCILIKKST